MSIHSGILEIIRMEGKKGGGGRGEVGGWGGWTTQNVIKVLEQLIGESTRRQQLLHMRLCVCAGSLL